MARSIMYYRLQHTFSRNGGVCTINLEFVIENIKKSMLTCQRLLRVKLPYDAHILVHDGPAHVLLVSSSDWIYPHGSDEHFLKCASIIFESWI